MIHKSKDGKVDLLATLTDLHLLSIITSKLRVFATAKEVLSTDAKRDRFIDALYVEKMDEDFAKNFVTGFDRNIAPYIVEALIRKLDISIQLETYREILGRSSRITISYAQKQKLLSEYSTSYGLHGTEDEFDDEDVDDEGE